MPQRDSSWAPGWGLSGKWTQKDVDDEFANLTKAWQTAKDGIDALAPLVGGLRHRKELAELTTATKAAQAVVSSWDRAVPWSERVAALAALHDVATTIGRLRSQATTFGTEDEAAIAAEQHAAAVEQKAKAERIAKHETLMATQQAAKRDRLAEAARLEREAREAEEERQRKEDAERAATALREAQQRATDEQERVRLVKEEQQRKREEAERLKREAEERVKREQAERDRKAKAQREAAGRAAWSAALDVVVDGTEANAARTMPDAFGTKRLQLATLRTMLAAEERQLDEREWPIGEVTAITAGKDLADRWAAHQLASSNEPRAAFEVRAGRSGSPITKLGINAEKLWRFFGYPEASGRDYAMPQFTKDGTKFHFSLTGNSMHDLSALWKLDNTILTWPPERIFTALFETNIAPRRRIHITRELDGVHVFLGDVNGEGDPIPDHYFNWDAAVMKGELQRLRGELVAKLWDAKRRSWVLG